MKRQLKFAFLVILVALATAPLVYAQGKKSETQLRTVHGRVLDKDDTPVSDGVVFLKNTRTQTVKTYISDEGGNYRFSGLDPNADYQIHAEREGMASNTRSISSFDSRKDIELNLKLQKSSDK
ncbi:MAG TPA: carboxypeptidase-like regulatory domain-containing protein [Candidatus Dormibacteraeota bacterium]|nr:carboxypeptidase-like regulatory domain-containing protein [Candidatus Dormibacteraeota bacterium]